MIRIRAKDVSLRNCEQCKEPFVPRNSSAGRFCSLACFGRYRAVSHEQVLCAHCGKFIDRQIQKSYVRKNYFCNRMCHQDFRLNNRMSLEELFWKHVAKSDKPDGCWLWTGYCDRRGYGKLRYVTDGIQVIHSAPRLSWELHVGPIPDGLSVLHNCPGGDNPTCCNLNHLFLGTQLDNVRNCIAKGRLPRGEQSATAKLAEWQVVDIKRRVADGGVTYEALAREYGVVRQTISNIVNGRRWKHIP
jgi:hypothetical protein